MIGVKEIAVFGYQVKDIFTKFNRCPQVENRYHFTVIPLDRETIGPLISEIKRYVSVMFDDSDYYVAKYFVKNSIALKQNNIRYALINRSQSFEVEDSEIPIMYFNRPFQCKDVREFLDDWLASAEAISLER